MYSSERDWVLPPWTRDVRVGWTWRASPLTRLHSSGTS